MFVSYYCPEYLGFRKFVVCDWYQDTMDFLKKDLLDLALQTITNKTKFVIIKNGRHARTRTPLNLIFTKGENSILKYNLVIIEGSRVENDDFTNISHDFRVISHCHSFSIMKILIMKMKICSFSFRKLNY